jgi:hypothetical protein
MCFLRWCAYLLVHTLVRSVSHSLNRLFECTLLDLASHPSFFVTADTLRLLQITHIRHSKVGNAESKGISGGQKKRVNIGLELV